MMDTEEGLVRQNMYSHLKDLKSDTQLYGWDQGRNFPGVCLNQLEQGHCTWIDEVEKLKFRRALVWHPASSSPSALPTTRTSGRTCQHSHKSPAEYNGHDMHHVPRSARPTTPWDVKKAGSTQSTSISAPSAFCPSTVLSHTLRRIALGRGTASSCPHAGYSLALLSSNSSLIIDTPSTLHGYTCSSASSLHTGVLTYYSLVAARQFPVATFCVWGPHTPLGL